MVNTQIEIQNKLGLHARAATKLAGLAGRFACSLKIICKGKTIDAKSIMSIMLLAASKGTSIEIMADGEDENEALEALTSLINNKFDEGE
jgi:phosphocarrier protein